MTIKKETSAKKTLVKKTKSTDLKVTVKKATAKKIVTAKKVARKVKEVTENKAAKKVAAPKKSAAKKAPVKTKNAKAEKVVSKVIKDKDQLLVDAVVEGILNDKGRNISVLNLKDIHNRVCDYYIICQADSNTQVNAIAGSVEENVKKTTGERPYHSEGFQNSEWILVDYVTVVVHIFQSHIREFYNLESLWADAEVKEIAFE
jgi:ribosome-associated protein